MPEQQKAGASKPLSKEKCTITRIPLELVEEIRIQLPEGLKIWLPEGLQERFTKKDFCTAAKEPYSSLRLEVLRAAGIIEKVGEKNRYYVYSIRGGKEQK